MLHLKESVAAGLLVFLLCLPWTSGKLNKYCSICENHTMCKYQNIGPDCEDAGGSGVTLEERREIVDVHNWYRRVVAGGHETSGAGGPQPKGSNIMKLQWDNDLAQVAQRWADQCRLEHDVCRDDARWKVGQNIYWKWKYPTHNVNWTEAITSWYNEVSLFNPADVKSFRFDASTGHYTQMLWHDTNLIGCGRRDYGFNKLYVCNYGPTGNWIGEPMYTVGEPCSKCPAGSYCNDLLCDTRGSGTNRQNQNVLKPNNTKQILTQSKTSTNTNSASTTSKSTKRPNVLNASIMSRPTKVGLEQPISRKTPTTETRQETEDIQENIILDQETDTAVEDIKSQIQNLLKKVIKKSKLQH